MNNEHIICGGHGPYGYPLKATVNQMIKNKENQTT